MAADLFPAGASGDPGRSINYLEDLETELLVGPPARHYLHPVPQEPRSTRPAERQVQQHHARSTTEYYGTPPALVLRAV